MYLGAEVSKTVNPKHEIERRISGTMIILKQLDLFWNQTNCNQKWKLMVLTP